MNIDKLLQSTNPEDVNLALVIMHEQGLIPKIKNVGPWKEGFNLKISTTVFFDDTRIYINEGGGAHIGIYVPDKVHFDHRTKKKIHYEV